MTPEQEQAIRARHVKHDDWWCEAGEAIPAGQERCDIATLLAALDEARAMTNAAEAIIYAADGRIGDLEGERDAARADADRLAEALRGLARGPGEMPPNWEQQAAAREALRLHIVAMGGAGRMRAGRTELKR